MPTIRKINWLNGLAGSALLLTFATYFIPLFDQSSLAIFSQSYADILFLAFILLSIGKEFRHPGSLVDPIYWLLLGAAFAVWLGVSILKVTIFSELSNTAISTLTSVSYFLYYALAIAAIEVKSYSLARQLLAIPNLLIWGASLSFTLGAFIFLVLTPTRGIGIEQDTISSSFVFYILMDAYLAARWFFLSWSSRKTFWIGYCLFGIASINWMIADIVEGLSYTPHLSISHGGWLDWIWYTPYIAIFIGLQLRISNSTEHVKNPEFSATNFLNSPLFFVIICFLLERIISANPHVFVSLNNTQTSFFNLWISVSLLFATFQLILLIKNRNQLRSKLAEEVDARNALMQRMEQQAESLKNQAASNQAILETTHNAIFTLDLQGQILSCNPAACSLLGESQSALAGLNFVEATKAKGELKRFFTYQSYQQKLLNSTQGIEIEATICDSANQELPMHITLSQDHSNSEGLLVVSLINIKEQKQAEIEAHNLKDQFTQNISHEFRTPLTIINGVLDNLHGHEANQQNKAQIETAKRNVLRMIRMVEQLLELSRIANDPLPLSTINIATELSFVCQSFEEIAKNQSLDFHYSVPQEAWVKGNLQAAEKILFNLLSNAFKYTNQGSIKVELTKLDDQYKILVSDTGLGIDKDNLSQIFERFHRVDTVQTQSIHGVGIGLALVNELCDTMRWKIDVQSELKKALNLA